MAIRVGQFSVQIPGHFSLQINNWCCAGYHKIQKPRDRYVILDYKRLLMLADKSDYATFARNYLQWIDGKLKRSELDRDER